ncbi:MAG: site-2 protease family protein [Planctomycetota bacterium]
MLVEPKPSPMDLKWAMLGMPVRVSPWFFVAAILLGWSGSKSWAQATGQTQGAILLTWILAMFAGILVHELGHALVARMSGARNVRIVIYHLGGLAISEGRRLRWQRVVELLMGPGAGFLLGGACYGVLLLAQARGWELPALVEVFLSASIYIGLIWGLVNLLPVFPLDGGQITRELLEAWRPYDGMRIAFRVSVVASLIVAGLGIWLREFLIVVMFGLFAYYNWQLSRMPLGGGGGFGGGQPAQGSEPRQPWERDPDWWKG